MNPPNYDQIAAGVYQACTAYDQYLPALSVDVAKAWARAFQKYNLSARDLLAGVDQLYAERGSGYRPLPADITQAARLIRKERTEREPAAALSARQEALAVKAREDAEDLAIRKGITNLDPPKFQRKANPYLGVACPFVGCRAAVGQHCTNRMTGRRPAGGTHPSRIELATTGQVSQ